MYYGEFGLNGCQRHKKPDDGGGGGPEIIFISLLHSF